MKKAVQDVLPIHHSCNSVSTQEIQMINWARKNLSFSLVVVLALCLLKQQFENNGGSVHKPCGFDFLVISIMFCLVGSFGVLFIGDKPRLATLRNFYFVLSMVSMASASAILGFALFTEGFRLVSLGSYAFQVLKKTVPVSEQLPEVA